MDRKGETAPVIPGRTDSDESTVRCLAAKNVSGLSMRQNSRLKLNHGKRHSRNTDTGKRENGRTGAGQ